LETGRIGHFLGKCRSSVNRVKNYFKQSLDTYPDIPAVARVELRQEAVAKSHRPTDLFNDDTCPIIGGDQAGELFVSVNNKGLDNLKEEISRGRTRDLKANISALQKILPFRRKDVLESRCPNKLVEMAIETKSPIRMRLFRHPVKTINDMIDSTAEKLAAKEGIDKLEQIDYGENIRVYALHGASAAAIKVMSVFPGTQNLSLFPEYRTVKRASHVIGSLDDSRFPLLDPNEEFGIVGIIDSGTNPNNVRLQSYVVNRYDWVPRSQQDNDHGSFVAGLVANSRALNHGDTIFPSVRSKIIDFVALDDSGEIAEYDLITVIDKALHEYPNVRVWNLSLGQDIICKDGRFSLLACKLDSIAKKRNVLFVIAAGNFEEPLRAWPPLYDIGDRDRICPPADSIRGLTVGSLAHLETPNTCAKKGDPSPFSRRGPAPHFYIKPEVSHIGGNCDLKADFLQTGVISVEGNGNVAENIGTSYATPIISTLAANVFRELEPDDSLSPTLVKAMLVHSAFVRSGKPGVTEVRYRGFGSPGDLNDVLNCMESSATIIFYAELEEHVLFEKRDFPMPLCLQVPKKGLRAEVFMTLAYDPPTDARYGIEYCRSNVTASLGTVHKNKKTGEKFYRPQLRPAPRGITKGYEERLVKEGYKWSPLKLYYRKFNSGLSSRKTKWRLHLELLNRTGFVGREPQKVVLLVTIRDPLGRAYVYQSLLREMQRLAWGPKDLLIKSRLRLKQ
jgi:hypothetical protein